MAQVTKITLSKEEKNVLSDADFFYHKHTATEKVFELFAELERELRKNILEIGLDDTTLQSSTSKIFRGENYRKLPYVLLDYPKVFSSKNVFAFRSMCWWGKEFSFTMHLQGDALEKYRAKIGANISGLSEHEFYFCVSESPWNYYFEKDNYEKLDLLLDEEQTFLKVFSEKKFIKLSRKIPLSDYENVIEFGVETFRLAFSILK